MTLELILTSPGQRDRETSLTVEKYSLFVIPVLQDALCCIMQKVCVLNLDSLGLTCLYRVRCLDASTIQFCFCLLKEHEPREIQQSQGPAPHYSSKVSKTELEMVNRPNQAPISYDSIMVVRQVQGQARKSAHRQE